LLFWSQYPGGLQSSKVNHGSGVTLRRFGTTAVFITSARDFAPAPLLDVKRAKA
jgi:hypothetical protein